MTSGGSSGIQLANGGTLVVNPGQTTLTQCYCVSAGTGWYINPGGVTPATIGPQGSGRPSWDITATTLRLANVAGATFYSNGLLPGVANATIHVNDTGGTAHTLTFQSGLLVGYTTP
jgi:hypothetical protein